MKEIAVILLIICLLFSCEKETDIKFENSNFIVINSFFSPDSIFKVNVSESLSIINSSNVNFIENASIELYEDGNIIRELVYDNNGNYFIDYKPLQQKEYKIKVISPEGYNCEAINIIPQKTEIISIDTLTDITKPDELICKINFEDNQSTLDFYFLEIRTIAGSYTFEYPLGNFDTIYYEESIDFDYTDNIIEYKIGTSMITYGVIFSDELINGEQKEISITINKYAISDIPNNAIKFYLKNISEDFYLYAKSYSMLLDEEIDILAEPIQVYSNISNGFGIFGGYNQFVDSIIYNKELSP